MFAANVILAFLTAGGSVFGRAVVHQIINGRASDPAPRPSRDRGGYMDHGRDSHPRARNDRPEPRWDKTTDTLPPIRGKAFRSASARCAALNSGFTFPGSGATIRGGELWELGRAQKGPAAHSLSS